MENTLIGAIGVIADARNAAVVVSEVKNIAQVASQYA